MDAVGSKKGSGGVASEQDIRIHNKQRLNTLLNIDKDPYFVKNNLGQHECILCLTVHTSNESYLNHINGRKHQLNVLRRNKDRSSSQDSNASVVQNVIVKNDYLKKGTPEHKIVKIRDDWTKEEGLFIQVDVPLCEVDPIYRFMSCFEYLKDTVKDSSYQYLLIYAKPYEIISFKIPSKEINFDKFWAYYDKDIKKYYIQFLYKNQQH